MVKIDRTCDMCIKPIVFQKGHTVTLWSNRGISRPFDMCDNCFDEVCADNPGLLKRVIEMIKRAIS